MRMKDETGPSVAAAPGRRRREHDLDRSLTMRAVVLRQFGGPEVLRIGETTVPSPAEDQVLVRVSACGVCGHDLLARAGALRTPLPVVLGHEISGVVTQVGERVSELREGQRVALVQRIPCGTCSLCRRGATNLCRSGAGFYGEDLNGGYAEYVVASERNAVPLPATISDEVGATLSCAVGTGLRALRQADLNPGDLVIVTGAGGGVGLNTVKLAAAFDLRVLAVSGSPQKKEALLAAGAAEVVSPGSPGELRRVAKALSDSRGAEAVIEIAGPPTFSASLGALAPRGRLVLVGNTDPRPVQMNPGAVIVRELKIVGSAHATRSDLEEVIALVGSGKVSPTVGEVRPLEEATELHRSMVAREVTGRAVLRIREPARDAGDQT